MDCPARQKCDHFTSTRLQTIDFCWTKSKVTIKTLTLNNIRKSVELPGLCQIIHAFS